MKEAHTRSVNRALVKMRINSVAQALELESRVMLESTLRGRLFNAGARYLSAFFGEPPNRTSRVRIYTCVLFCT